jgi:hypothetical protein
MFEDMVDTARIDAARKAQAALVLAERDAAAAVEKAAEAVEAAEAASVQAAHDDKPDDALEAAERLCEDAARTHAIARKKLIAARKRVADGAVAQRREVARAHARAIQAGMAKRVALVREAHAIFDRLEEAKLEYRAVGNGLLTVWHSMGGKPRGELAIEGDLLNLNGKPVDLDWLRAVWAGCGYDLDGRAAWMTE